VLANLREWRVQLAPPLSFSRFQTLALFSGLECRCGNIQILILPVTAANRRKPLFLCNQLHSKKMLTTIVQLIA
jgi:hypothetical protein